MSTTPAVRPGQIVYCNQVGHNYGPHQFTDVCTTTSVATRDALVSEAARDGWLRSYLESAGVSVDGLADEFPQCVVCGHRNVEDAGEHAESTGHWPIAPYA